jgi:hypothetical protein
MRKALCSSFESLLFQGEHDPVIAKNHAFLVLAHEDELMLTRLVNRLAPIGQVLIHVDAKTNISKWKFDGANSTLLRKRIPVFWGSWSMVEATMLLIEEALSDPAIERFTLLSGTHYPIISNDDLTQRASSSGNVIAARVAPNMADGSRPVSEYERLFLPTRRPNGSWSKVKNGLANRVPWQGPLDWQSVCPATGMRAGSQYWSLQRDVVEYCATQIRSSRPLIKYFEKIVCSDEKVFATLYSEFSDEVSSEGTTFVKWNGSPSPDALTRSDVESAIRMDQFWFARKFHSNEPETLDWLDRQ